MELKEETNKNAKQMIECVELKEGIKQTLKKEKL